jgi:hypothetical protein
VKVRTHLRAGQYSLLDANPLNFPLANASCTPGDLVNSAAPDGMVTLQSLADKHNQNYQMLVNLLTGQS